MSVPITQSDAGPQMGTNIVITAETYFPAFEVIALAHKAKDSTSSNHCLD